MQRIVYFVFIVALAACSSGDGPTGSDGEFSTERKLAIRSWRTPERAELVDEPEHNNKNVLDLEARNGRLLMLVAIARDLVNLPAWHRELILLEHDGSRWIERGRVPRTALFIVGSIGIGNQDDAYVFWSADPPDAFPPDDAPNEVVVRQTALYGCHWVASSCSVVDSLLSDRRSIVSFSDVLVTSSGSGRVLADHSNSVRDLEMNSLEMGASNPWSGIFPSLTQTRSGELAVAGGRKLETNTGFRLYAQTGNDGVWDGSRTVFESAGESAQTSNLLYDSSGTAHVVFWAFPGSGEATLYHAMSDDDGLTWSDPVDVGFISSGFPTDRPQLEEDMNGTLHLVWGVSFRFNETEYFENLYRDGSWTPSSEWSVGDTGFKWNVKLTSSSDGRLHAAWRSEGRFYYSVYE